MVEVAGVVVGQYEYSYGTLNVVLNRYVRQQHLFALTMDMIGIGPLRGNGEDRSFHTSDLAHTGDYVTRMILLNREVEWAAAYMVTGVWGTDSTGGTGFTQWSDYDASDPIADFRTARLKIKKNTGYTPNTAVIAQEVFEVLADHPLIKELYKYTAPAILTPELVARALRVDRLFIAGGIKLDSAEGAANTFDWIFAKRAWLGYVNPRPALMAASAGYIFSWRGFTQGYEVGIERIPDRRVKADYTQGFSAYALKVVASDLGYLFDSAVA